MKSIDAHGPAATTPAELGRWRVLAPGVWFLTYAFDAHGTANCLAVALANDEVAVFSPAVGMTDEAFEALGALGRVSVLVAPNGMHHLGQASWRARFPHARCFAPRGAIDRITKKNPAAGDFEPLASWMEDLGERVLVREAPGARHGESWVIVRTESGFAWFVSDVLANMPEPPRPFLPRLMFRLSGSAPGFRVFHLALLAGAKDKRALLQALRADVERHPPQVLLPAHGDPVRGPDVHARTLALLS